MPTIASFGVAGSNSRVYYAAASAHVIELAWVGQWIFNDLTAITRGELATNSPSTIACLGIAGNNSRVYFPSRGAMSELAWIGNWIESNVAASAGAPVVYNIALACFGVDGRNPRVYCTAGNDNHVFELAWQDGWTHKDVTAITGAPPIGFNSDLTCFGFDVSSFGAGGPAARVYYSTQNGHVIELAWDVESFENPEGRWVQNDISVLTGAPLADPKSVTCLGVGGLEGLEPPSARVYYVDAKQHVNELAFVGKWVFSDLTAITGASPARQASPLACFAAGASAPHVYYIDGHVNELAWDGKQWVHADLTAIAGGPSPINFGDLSCFGLNGSDPRVYYYSQSNGHVNEFAWVGRWTSNDLTAITGAPSLPFLP